MSELAQELDALAAESSFAGVVRIDRGDEVVVEKAYGLARPPMGDPEPTGHAVRDRERR